MSSSDSKDSTAPADTTAASSGNGNGNGNGKVSSTAERIGQSTDSSGTTQTSEAGASAGRAARILPLGNSITQAESGHASYRFPLWQKLTEADCRVDFVGSLRTRHRENPDRLQSYPDPSFDRDHEGRWGWTADQILSRLDRWLSSYTADIVLMHLGTNDAFRGEPVDDTIDELKRIVAKLQADNPHVAILLAKLIPVDSDQDGRIVERNRKIGSAAAKWSTPTSPVLVVDQHSGFDPNDDTYDRVHPNENGEEKMAKRWAAKLKPLLVEAGYCK